MKIFLKTKENSIHVQLVKLETWSRMKKQNIGLVTNVIGQVKRENVMIYKSRKGKKKIKLRVNRHAGTVLSGGEVLENQFPVIDNKRLYHPTTNLQKRKITKRRIYL